MHVNTAEHGVHIGQKACQTALGKAFTEYHDGAPRVGGLPVCQLAAGQQSADGELHVRRAVVADLVHLREKGQHPAGDVLALFKLALGNGAVGKTHTVPPQYCLHGETEGFVEQVVLFAPFGKVLATVHDARQRARDGEGRQRHLFVRQQPEHGGDGFRQTLHAPLGQGDVQPCKAAARLLSGGVLPAAVFDKLLQFAIPALRAFVIHDQRAEHAHALHQRGGCENFRLRQAAVVFFHLGIVPHAGVKFCITHQQLGNLGMVTAAGVAFQGVGVVLLQLIVQPAPADERFALFLGILPFHLPKEKSPETRPEVEALAVFVAQHSSVSKNPVQPFAGTGIAADHPRHFQVKTFKGGQLQQEAPHRQIKAPVDSGLKVEEHLVVHPRHQLRRPRLVRGHAPRRDGHTQRIAHGFFQYSVNLAICYVYSRKLKQPPHIARVKKQVVGLQHRHQPRVLKRRQAAGRHTAREQHEMALRT